MRRLFTVVAGLAGALALVALWHACSVHGLVSSVFLPSPATTWDALSRGLGRGELAPQCLQTVLRMLQGWVAASVVAVALGILIGLSRRARAYLQPTLQFLRPLPAAAVIPVVIALFGLTHAMVFAVIVFGAVWPALLSTVRGVSSVEPRLIEVAKLLRLSRSAVAIKISLPNAIPRIVAGMRLSLTVALALSIVCEMMAGETGLGNGILLAGRSLRTDDLFAGLVLLGVIGLVSNYALLLVERQVSAWK
jgi:sulfonate transport system permease protein